MWQITDSWGSEAQEGSKVLRVKGELPPAIRHAWYYNKLLSRAHHIGTSRLLYFYFLFEFDKNNVGIAEATTNLNLVLCLLRL